MAVPWLSYVPLPGLAFVAVWAAPDDRVTRYHAWQGGILVAGLYTSLIIFGLLSRISEAAAFQTVLGLAAGLVLIAAAVGMVMGAISAAKQRFIRIHPAWDVAAAFKR